MNHLGTSPPLLAVGASLLMFWIWIVILGGVSAFCLSSVCWFPSPGLVNDVLGFASSVFVKYVLFPRCSSGLVSWQYLEVSSRIISFIRIYTLVTPNAHTAHLPHCFVLYAWHLLHVLEDGLLLCYSWWGSFPLPVKGFFKCFLLELVGLRKEVFCTDYYASCGKFRNEIFVILSNINQIWHTDVKRCTLFLHECPTLQVYMHPYILFSSCIYFLLY